MSFFYGCDSSVLFIKGYSERLLPNQQASLRITSDVMDEVVNTKLYSWKYKCQGRSVCAVWEWPFIHNTSSLTGYIFPLSSPLHRHFQTIAWFRWFCYNTPLRKHGNLRLITSDGSTLTAPVLPKLNKECDLWHPLSWRKVCVIVLQLRSAPKGRSL